MSSVPAELPEGLEQLLACRDCKLQRYARLAPACVNHLEALIEALRSWQGTPLELDEAIDARMWPRPRGTSS